MMAKELADAELCLPSELVYDDLLGETQGKDGSAGVGFAKACFPSDILFGLAYRPDSLAEEFVTVSETESDDEEDYMAGLTRWMAHSFLHEDDDDKDIDAYAKSRVMAGSPQSTLCGWSSNKASPDSPSLFSSPPLSPVEKQPDVPMDMLCEAAGQVMRMRINDLPHRQDISDRDVLDQPKKPAPTVSAPSRTTTGCYHTNTPALNLQQFRAAEVHHLKQKQLARQQASAVWGGRRPSKLSGGDGGSYASHYRPLGLPPSAWPPLQKAAPPQKPPLQQQMPQPSAGMRAVFLNASCARKESAGTGVFLPRTAGSKTELRKKRACSTVFVPPRVVQALNLNIEKLGVQPRFPGGFVLNQDAFVSSSNYQKQNQHLRAQPAAMAMNDADHLPQEWTY